MKPIVIMIVSLFIGGFPLHAQPGIDEILGEIEKNNTTLSAIRNNTAAGKIGNKTGVFLQNPEFEFHYLWRDPTTVSNRTDILIRQTFDFPTVYSYKNQIATQRNNQLDIEYRKQRNSVLMQARLTLVDIIYTNALQSFFESRLVNATNLAAAYKNKLDAGDASILDYNKAQLYLLNLKQEAVTNEINRNALLARLAGYNNGVYIDFSDTTFKNTLIPVEFEQWYLQMSQYIPELNYIKSEIEISQKQQQLSLAMSLPRFSAGYMSETITNEQLQGITAGISIPLWENKNTIKYAKARTIALQSLETDQELQIYNQLKAYHAKIISLQNTVIEYRSSLQSFDNTGFLDKALEKGEITLIDYILELSVYYSSFNNLLETEKELNKAIAEFFQFMQ